MSNLPQAELRELSRLVLGECLRRVQIERPAMVIANELVQDRKVERQRLAGSGPTCDDDVALARGLQRLELMGVQSRDAAAEQPGV